MKNPYRYLLPAIIGLTYFLALLTVVPVGDDLAYSIAYDTSGLDPGLTAWLRTLVRHVIHVNNRMFDTLAPVWLGRGPWWLLSLAGGVGTAAFFALAGRATGKQSTPLRLTLLFLVLLLGMPWWDNTMLMVVQANYVWTSALVLGAICVLIYSPALERAQMWWAVALAFVAAWCHEAAGISVLAGTAAWLYVRGGRQTRFERLFLIATAAGVLFVIASPAFVGRLSGRYSAPNPDDPMLLLTLKSSYFVLAMIAVTAVTWIIDRARIRTLVHTPWTLFAVAAVTGMCISSVSGIVGRSGWFGQVFALIALWRMLPEAPRRPALWTLGAAGLLTVLAAMYCGYFVKVQHETGAMLRAQVEAFRSRPSEPVYMDYVTDADMPAILLHRARTVVDHDDEYFHQILREAYGGDSLSMILLPLEARGITCGPVPRGRIAPSVPAALSPDSIAVPCPGGYYITVRDIDPGDR